MKTIYLVFIILLTNLYSSEHENKINEYCTIKASVYTSELVYKHEYTYCTKTLTNKKLSIKEIDTMIKNEPSEAERKTKAQEKEKNTKFIEPAKNLDYSSTSFDISNESCYYLGMAFGACSIRSMYNMTCEPGTNFVMPPRCRKKSTTQQGIKDGVLFQKLLIQKSVYR